MKFLWIWDGVTAFLSLSCHSYIDKATSRNISTPKSRAKFGLTLLPYSWICEICHHLSETIYLIAKEPLVDNFCLRFLLVVRST